MYGTVARMMIKPGMEEQFERIAREVEGVEAPGQVAAYVYQMDRDSREYYLAAVFESKEAYFTNANSPEQHERFMTLMQVLEAEPEWNDGTIVFASA